ncbi:MAG TPA: YcnI family protein [Actinomycetota bacterium]|nr:YcnI family protein [Actinomycetota bacterium]
MRHRSLFAGVTLAVTVALAAPAAAHVTVQPNEATKGSFSRFVVRVPNERDDARTTKVTLELPPLASVSFQPKDGWKRTVEMVELDEPLEAFGNEITEVVGSVTWSGGSIAPGEFDEFGFSALMPDETTTLEFPAHQTYSSGEVVDWVEEAEGEAPAARVSVYDIGAGEDEGQLAVLARVSADQGAEEDAEEDDDDDGAETAPLILGGAGFVMGLAALAVSLRSRS